MGWMTPGGWAYSDMVTLRDYEYYGRFKVPPGPLQHDNLIKASNVVRGGAFHKGHVRMTCLF